MPVEPQSRLTCAQSIRLPRFDINAAAGTALPRAAAASIIAHAHLKWCAEQTGVKGLDRGLDRRTDACRAFYAAR